MYKLKHKILGHSSDVRCVSTVDCNRFITGSRDTSNKVYSREDSSEEFLPCKVVTNDETFANCVKFFNTGHEDRFAVGTASSVVYIYNQTFELLYKLVGHTNNVSCIDYSDRNHHIITGSWDANIKVWDMNNSGVLVQTLYGHEQSVWCVRCVTGFNLMLSASADKTIKLWKNYNHVKTFIGHTQPVRDILVLSDKRTFLSCSNDMNIIKWDIVQGTLIKVVGLHKNFVYSLASLGNDNFVSTGEDGQIIIWKEDNKYQEITTVCNSVWSVDTLGDNEFVAACSDGYLRIYTNDEAFDIEVIDQAPDQTNDIKYESSNIVNSQSKLSNARALEDDPNIPDSSVGLVIPGTKEGQVTIVRNQGKVQVYEWSVDENKWKPFGDVLTDDKNITNSHNSKIYFEGKEYDYVFDVDLEGQRMLKLPYNNGQDELDAATNFLSKYSLSPIYTEQVVGFIKANVKPAEMSTNNKLTPYKLHKFRTVNLAGMFKSMSNVLSIPSKINIPNDDIIKIKLEVNKINQNQFDSLDSIIDQNNFPWQTFYDILDEFNGKALVPFMDLLRVLSLDFVFTEKFVNGDQLNKLVYRFLIEDTVFDEIIVMLLLKTVNNMIFLTEPNNNCAIVMFFMHNSDLFGHLKNALFWLTPRCQIVLSTLIYNLCVNFFNDNSNLSRNKLGLKNLFHQTLGCLLFAFQITDYSLEDESLFRLLTAIKIILTCNCGSLLENDQKSSIKDIVCKYVDERPSHDAYHTNPNISSCISDLAKILLT